MPDIPSSDNTDWRTLVEVVCIPALIAVGNLVNRVMTRYSENSLKDKKQKLHEKEIEQRLRFDRDDHTFNLQKQLINDLTRRQNLMMDQILKLQESEAQCRAENLNLRKAVEECNERISHLEGSS